MYIEKTFYINVIHLNCMDGMTSNVIMLQSYVTSFGSLVGMVTCILYLNVNVTFTILT